MHDDQPQPIRLCDYRPPDYRVDAVALDFDLHATATRVHSRLTMARREGIANAPALVLDCDDLRLLSLALDGRPLGEDAYRLEAGRLVIPSPPPSFTLEATTEIDPQANTKLEGLYLSNGVFCTQCEAEGFRRITCFPDRPDVMARYTVTLRADKTHYPVLLSNGNLVAQDDLPDGRHSATWDDPFPKPSYLFAVVAGDLGCLEDRFVTRSGRTVRLRIFCEHGNEPRCTYAMDALKRAMRWDEERFGLEYDLDHFNIVAIGHFNMGAMENKSLNIFNARCLLADPQSATDDDYAAIETIVAHEYFHNWTGNRVTCRDWFQLSLKEGLTVFRDQEFTADMRSRPVKRIQDVRALRARQFPEDAGPLAHPVRPDSYIEINNFYTPTVYEKGAEVIGMMQRLLGRDAFRRGMDLYIDRHDGQAVTCDDFVRAMQDAGGVALDRFKLWYSQAGTPEVAAEDHYDAAAHRYDLTLSQTILPTPGQSEKRPMHIPLAVGLVGPDGGDLPLRLEGEDAAAAATTRVLHLTETRQTFRFVDVPVPPALSLNREFTAPIRLRTIDTEETRAFLMAHDSDPFNRWEAGQQYATALLLDMVEAVKAGAPLRVDNRYPAALAGLLREAPRDRAFAALALVPPSEDYLADQMDVVDVEAIHQAREALRRAVAAQLKDDLLETYRANGSNEPYAPDPESAGRRSLKNVALAYLALVDDAAMRELVEEQYRSADNMTDRMAALGILNRLDGPARDAALEDFYARFSGDSLIVDKWFAVQAASPLPDTLARVTALLGHPAFTLINPNRARALIGGFAGGNAVRFHAADGGGYAFLADQVLALDGLNPKTAARLLLPLGRWARFDAGRQDKMRAQLARIAAAPNLSRDVFEIASKALG